jgi:ribonuclease J
MRICIHHGGSDIGGGCIEVISVNGQKLVIDLGLPVDNKKNNKMVLPEISALHGKDDTLQAILVTHLYLDHFGLLGHIPDNIPVIMGADARRILILSAPFLPGYCPIPVNGKQLQSEIPFDLGPFKITPFLIDHPAHDAYSILIEADGKRVFYSGDFRMNGRKAELTHKLMVNPPSNIDVLLLEGSTPDRMENLDSYPKEKEIEEKLVALFSCTIGHTLLHTSTQTINRITSILKACKRTGKTLVIDLYTSVVLEAAGIQTLPQSDWPEIGLYIPQLDQIRRNKFKWHSMLKKHLKNRIFIGNLQSMSKKCAILFRPMHLQDFDEGELLKEAVYICFQWEGFYEHESYDYLQKWLENHYIPIVNLQTSGHTNLTDLKQFADAILSTRIVPVHPVMSDQYNGIFENVEVHPFGEYWEV